MLGSSRDVADKMPAAWTAAVEAVRGYVAAMNPSATGLILLTLLHEVKTAGKWQLKTGSITIINQLAVSFPFQVAKLTLEIVPVLAEAIWDTKADVKKAARLARKGHRSGFRQGHRTLSSCPDQGSNQSRRGGTLYHLGDYIPFRSRLHYPPPSWSLLLSRGLTEKLMATKRKLAVISDNMVTGTCDVLKVFASC